MRVKRFKASDMRQAVARVRAEFGSEAVILETRQSRQGGLFGLFSRPVVEVTAAVDPPTLNMKRGAAGDGPAPDGPPKAGGKVSAAEAIVSQIAAREMRGEFGSAEEVATAVPPPPAGAPPAVPVAPVGIRATPGTGVELTPRAKAVPGGEPLNWTVPARQYFQRLLRQGVERDWAAGVIEEAMQRLDIERAHDAEAVRTMVRRQLAASIPTVPPWRFDTGEPVVAAFVGPTGVGKTTSIAKLAANFSLIAGRRVGLVTVDTYRIGAVDQLKKYAEMMNLPLKVALTPDELRDTVNSLREVTQLVLVDTAGRSPLNPAHLEELRQFLLAVPEAQIHLVIAAATPKDDIATLLDRFDEPTFDRVVATKLDETVYWGQLYNSVRHASRPLAYLATGQSVPEDIESADGERLASLLLGEGAM